MVRNGLIDGFIQHGKASFIIGGQFGSEGKGAAAAYVATQCRFDVVTANNGSQSGHTSIHDGRKRVLFHLPTAPLVNPYPGQITYLNAGAVIDPVVLWQELESNQDWSPAGLYIHPNAAVITQECKDAENGSHSAQTKIASTRKGVGEAVARKALRSGQIARSHPALQRYVHPFDLNHQMQTGVRVLVEVPQGFSLSINSSFYPHCTSRDSTIAQAASDAGIHPDFVGPRMLVLRTYPIRVGHIIENGDRIGYSGDCYGDQHELAWGDVGVPAEITTVTKRPRRIFSFSEKQAWDALSSTRPTHVMLTFCNYVQPIEAASLATIIDEMAKRLGLSIKMLFEYGPTTADIHGRIL